MSLVSSVTEEGVCTLESEFRIEGQNLGSTALLAKAVQLFGLVT